MNNEGNFVILKLVSGEQVMATMTGEDDTSIAFEYPMLIKLIRFIQNGITQEHVTASPFCEFSDDKQFNILKTNIIFVKKMHQMIVPHYLRLVDEHEASILVRKELDGSVGRISFDDENEDINFEEIQRRIIMQDIANPDLEIRFFIEGNSTVN
jgi:hypothetical protein